jgi:hypothetical protein
MCLCPPARRTLSSPSPKLQQENSCQETPLEQATGTVTVTHSEADIEQLVAEQASNERLYRAVGMWPVSCLRASIEPVIFFDARWMHGFKLTDNNFNGVNVNVNVRCEWHVSEVWFLS